ncbi:MAG: hypothetical protein QXU74_02260 [Candidatus Aenigmatarchaeota archaeon]
MELKKARIIMHCLCDGWIRCYKDHFFIGYSNFNQKLIKQFISDMKVVYNLENYQKWKHPVTNVEFASKKAFFDILAYIKNKDKNKARIPEEIMNGSPSIRLLALRVFWDDEGTVGFYGKSRYLRAKCFSEKLRNQIIKLHKSVGIRVIDDKSNKAIKISSRENIRKFARLINFTSGVKVCAKTKRPVWVGYEKCKVLELLLQSYP